MAGTVIGEDTTGINDRLILEEYTSQYQAVISSEVYNRNRILISYIEIFSTIVLIIHQIGLQLLRDILDAIV
jgi:hypothetical protein